MVTAIAEVKFAFEVTVRAIFNRYLTTVYACEIYPQSPND
jgi:hypothetical protein